MIFIAIENQSAREARNREVTARTKPSGRLARGGSYCAAMPRAAMRRAACRATAHEREARAARREADSAREARAARRERRDARARPASALRRYSHRHALMLLQPIG